MDKRTEIKALIFTVMAISNFLMWSLVPRWSLGCFAFCDSFFGMIPWTEAMQIMAFVMVFLAADTGVPKPNKEG